MKYVITRLTRPDSSFSAHLFNANHALVGIVHQQGNHTRRLLRMSLCQFFHHPLGATCLAIGIGIGIGIRRRATNVSLLIMRLQGRLIVVSKTTDIIPTWSMMTTMVIMLMVRMVLALVMSMRMRVMTIAWNFRRLGVRLYRRR